MGGTRLPRRAAILLPRSIPQATIGRIAVKEGASTLRLTSAVADLEITRRRRGLITGRPAAKGSSSHHVAARRSAQRSCREGILTPELRERRNGGLLTGDCQEACADLCFQAAEG